MPIQVGDSLPPVTLKHLTSEGLQETSTKKLFHGKKVVMFALPGAYTPTCSAKHLPEFVERADEIKAKGIDAIYCLSVNDPFVMSAWGKQNNVEGKVFLLPDGNAEFTHELGLGQDLTINNLGFRSKRYAMIVENGVVRHLAIEKPGEFTVSSAEAVLKLLS
ncbi:Glutathione-dependent peroxiredoxin [Azospirillaceae bacterium]